MPLPLPVARCASCRLPFHLTLREVGGLCSWHFPGRPAESCYPAPCFRGARTFLACLRTAYRQPSGADRSSAPARACKRLTAPRVVRRRAARRCQAITSGALHITLGQRRGASASIRSQVQPPSAPACLRDPYSFGRLADGGDVDGNGHPPAASARTGITRWGWTGPSDIEPILLKGKYLPLPADHPYLPKNLRAGGRPRNYSSPGARAAAGQAGAAALP